jgi:hypothetical protein
VASQTTEEVEGLSSSNKNNKLINENQNELVHYAPPRRKNKKIRVERTGKGRKT